MLLVYASEILAAAADLLSNAPDSTQPGVLVVNKVWGGTLQIQVVEVATLDCSIAPAALVIMLQVHNIVAACAEVWKVACGCMQ